MIVNGKLEILYNLLLKLTIVLLLVAGLINSSYGNKDNKSSAITPGSTYKIENQHDHLYLTIQGANASFATVVNENWLNFRAQKWTLVKLAGNTGYHLLPSSQQSNNFLSYVRTEGQRFPTPVTWSLLESSSRPDTYQMQNTRTKFCLATAGRRKQVIELPCDHYQKSQLWKLTKV